jgi:7,8-dihydroneopterin aldolase/epimerase/oxygenase
MDKIVVRNLELYGWIGVSASEREVGQRLLVNLEVAYDLARAGQSDDLNDTISYAELAQTVQEIGQSTRCELLEHMAEQMATAVLRDFPVTSVRLQLLKKPPPTEMLMEAAGVEIIRPAGNGLRE